MKSFFLLFAAGLLLFQSGFAQRLDDNRLTHDPFQKRTVPAQAIPGGRYLSHSVVNNALRIKISDGSTLQLTPWAVGVVKVDYFAPGHALQADSSVSVISSAASLPVNNSLRLEFGDGMQALVQKNPLRVCILSNGDTLLAEAAGAYRTQAAAPSAAINAAPGGTAVRFRLAPGERLYGTGSRALPLDRRGYRLDLYNQAHYGSQNGEPNLNITLPVVLSSRGYLLLFDHYTAGYLDLGKTDPNVLEYGGEGLSSLSYYVVTGKNQAQILEHYTALTGRQPLPPRWALGLIQSRFGYKTDTEMMNVASRMRRENFPLDALVLDLFWFGGTKRQGDFVWDKTNFPDPSGMMTRLKSLGVNTILISEPYVMRTSRNDSTVRTLGLVGTTAAGKPFTVGSFWAGPASILDVYKPKTAAWMWAHYKTLHDQGAAGWWSDLGEPENHPETMHHAWGLTRRVHNAYGQVWAGIFQTNYQKEYPNERLFNLARSGWAGMQRNSVFPWSGDINRSWSGLQAQIPVMLGMGQAGVGYMHSDAGGFCVGSVDPELYTRWLQMASLCPILRPHGEGVPPEPYWFPNPYKDAVRQATHLRYELLPYLYSLAYQNSLTGAPIVRTLDFDTPFNEELKMKNEELAKKNSSANSSHASTLPTNSSFFIPHSSLKENSEYLLGPNLLVAPILQPSQRRRNVLLPSGSWVDYYSNQTYPGGRVVGVVAPLTHTPLLVKAGAFLPMTAYRPTTARYRPDTLLLRYYPDPKVGESAFTMYDDDGHSAQAIAKHQYETFTARAFYSAQQTDVLLSSAGEYPGQPVFRLLRLLVQRVAAPPTAVYLDGQIAPAEGYSFNPTTHELDVHFLMNAGTAVSLRGLKLLTSPLPDLDPDVITLKAPDARTFGTGGTTLHYTCHVFSPTSPSLLIRSLTGTIVGSFPLNATPGSHTLAWDARDSQHRPLPPGVYLAEVAGQHQRLILTQSLPD